MQSADSSLAAEPGFGGDDVEGGSYDAEGENNSGSAMMGSGCWWRAGCWPIGIVWFVTSRRDPSALRSASDWRTVATHSMLLTR